MTMIQTTSIELGTDIDDNVNEQIVEEPIVVKSHRSAPPLPKPQENVEVVQVHEAYVPRNIVNESVAPKIHRSAPPPPTPQPTDNFDNVPREPFIRRDFAKPIPQQRRSLEIPADYDYESENAMTDPLPTTKNTKYYDSDRSSVHSNSSSTYRKSVSFDLGNNEYKPVYEVDKQAVQSKFSIEDRLNEERENYYSPRTPDDRYNNNFKYGPVLSSSSGKPHFSNQDPTKVYVREGSVERVRGILRSPSPKIETRDQITSIVKSRRDKVACDDTEEDTDQENPFRQEVLAHAQNNFNAHKLRRPVSMYDNKQHELSYGSDSLAKSNDNLLAEEPQKKIPIKIPLYQSTGAINSNKPYSSHQKRPLVAPKPFTKHADLVKNEGVVLMEQERAKGDYVEYMHDRETNQVIEVFPDNIPLPPPPSSLTKIPIRRNMSVERPKESPPPPPPMKSPVSPIDMTKVELVPARFEMRPVPSRPEFIRKSPEADIVLVTEDIHRQILLEENDIRNARQTERELEEERARNQRLYEENLRMRSQIQNSKIPIPSATQSTTHYTQPPPLPSSIPPPPPQVVPIHMTQLPIPQQTGYYQFVPSGAPLQFNYPPQAAFAPYGSVVGSYLVSDTQNHQSIHNIQYQQQQIQQNHNHVVTNTKEINYKNGSALPLLDMTNTNLSFETVPIRVMHNNSMQSTEIVPVSPSATSFGKN